MITDIYNTDKKYGIIYTDPPWNQRRGNKKKSRPNSSGTGLPYPTMSLDDIARLHMTVTSGLTEENHNIFLWTIEKYLREAEDMMRLLGYQLHVRIIWDKENGPAPAYTLRFAHEYLLWFFRPGHILLPDRDQRGAYTTVIHEHVHKQHSRKPEAAYQLIESMFPEAAKLELFARQTRTGWDAWGNEVMEDSWNT